MKKHLTAIILLAAAMFAATVCYAQTPEHLAVARSKALFSTAPTELAELTEDSVYTTLLYDTIYEGLAAGETQIDLSACDFPVSAYEPYEFIDFYSLICHEHPELYYVYPNTVASLSSIGKKLYIVEPIYTETDKDVIASTQRDIENAIMRLVDLTKTCSTDAEKVIAVHDALVLETAYDLTESHYSAKNALLDHICVCQGYSDAFFAVMYRIGIPCAFISSDEMVHVWNAVEVDGEWYHVDCTFDDATYNGYDVVCGCMHDYVLLGNEALLAVGDHHGFPFLLNDGNAFDGVPWRGVDSHITSLAGNLYYADNDAFGIMRYDTLTGKADKLVDFKELGFKWRHPETGKTWASAFSSLEYADGYFYYNSADTVYAMTPDGSQTKTVCKADLSASQSVYGLKIEDGKIHVAVGDLAKPLIRTPASLYTLPKAENSLFVVNDREYGGSRAVSVASTVKEEPIRLFVYAAGDNGRLTDVYLCTLPVCGTTLSLPASFGSKPFKMIVTNDALSPLASLCRVGE